MDKTCKYYFSCGHESWCCEYCTDEYEEVVDYNYYGMTREEAIKELHPEKKPKPKCTCKKPRECSFDEYRESVVNCKKHRESYNEKPLGVYEWSK